MLCCLNVVGCKFERLFLLPIYLYKFADIVCSADDRLVCAWWLFIYVHSILILSFNTSIVAFDEL